MVRFFGWFLLCSCFYGLFVLAIFTRQSGVVVGLAFVPCLLLQIAEHKILRD